MKRMIAMLLALMMVLSLCACGKQEVAEVETEAPATTAAPETTVAAEPAEVTITDMIGREVTIVPGPEFRGIMSSWTISALQQRNFVV